MNRSMMRCFAVMGLVSAIGLAWGQNGFPPGGPEGGPQGPGPEGAMRAPSMTPLMLLRMTTVQKELGLTSAQLEKIKAVRPAGPRRGPGGGEGMGAPGQGPQGGPGQGQRRPNPFAAVDKILSEKQLARLKQLVLQFDGLASWPRPEVSEALKLTDAQLDKIQDILEATLPQGPGMGGPGGPGGPGGDMGPGGPGGPDMGPGGPGGGPEMGPGPDGPGMGPDGGLPRQIPFAELQKKKAEALKKGLALLSADQKSVWNKLTGAAFTSWQEPRRPQRPEGEEN